MEIPLPGPELPLGPLVPRRGGRIQRALGRGILRAIGWQIEGGLPNLSKVVVIVAPHSSNWDFIIGIASAFALRLDVHWVGKAELFRGPLGALMRALGGLPVDRHHPEGFVAQLVARFAARPTLVLAMAPEGTRRPVERWKTGFYRVALGAGVPIVPVYLDNARKRLGFGAPFRPSGDAALDLAELRTFYAEVPRRG